MLNNKKLHKLIEELKSPDPARRRMAAEALSEGDERAIYPLIKIFRDQNPGVQDAAMRSLISMGQEVPSCFSTPPEEEGIFDHDGQASPGFFRTNKKELFSAGRGEVVAYMVLPLLRDDSYLRNTAIIILREIGAISVPLLYPLLSDKDDDVRKFSLDLLSDIKTGIKPEKIVPLLNDLNPNVRASAAKTVAALKYYDALPLLLEILKDEEWVAFSVLETLGELKDERAVGPVAELLSGESEALRFAAIEALGSIASPLCIQPLREFISETESFDKMVAIKSLLRIGISPDMTDLSGALMEMLESEEWDDKLLALKGIVTLRHLPAVVPIVDLAGSLDLSLPENEEILLILQDALVRMNAEDVLMELLKDEAVRYRGKTVAIQVLGNLKSRHAVPGLIDILKSSFRDLRRAGAQALGEIEAVEAMPYLIEAMEDEDGHVRKAAVIALGQIGEASAYGPLTQLLKHERYKDIVEETVRSLLEVNPSGLMADLDSLGDEIKDIVARFADDLEG